MRKMKCVHITNFCKIGGIGGFCRDFALTFPEFEHEMIFVNDHDTDLSNKNWLENNGIKCLFHPQITEEVIREVRPALICLHNAKDENFPSPRDWFKSVPVINFHHTGSFLFPNTDLDVFISDYVRWMFLGHEKHIHERFKVVYPAVYSPPYQQCRRTDEGLPVIGRIQSGSLIRAGNKFTGFPDLVGQVQGAKFILVGGNYKNLDERFTVKPAIPGAMPEYLRDIDIFALDCPSTESWSRVATEAMMAGKPVVAVSYGDGLTEQLAKAGGILAENQERFVEILQVLVNNRKLREEIGSSLQTWALQNCDHRYLRQSLVNDLFTLIGKYWGNINLFGEISFY